jgi:hypothetical protein
MKLPTQPRSRVMPLPQPLLSRPQLCCSCLLLPHSSTLLPLRLLLLMLHHTRMLLLDRVSMLLQLVLLSPLPPCLCCRPPRWPP